MAAREEQKHNSIMIAAPNLSSNRMIKLALFNAMIEHWPVLQAAEETVGPKNIL
jgi:hypothetical protein